MTLKEVIEFIVQWIEDKKTGSIQVNFFRGGISTVKFTEILKTK